MNILIFLAVVYICGALYSKSLLWMFVDFPHYFIEWSTSIYGGPEKDSELQKEARKSWVLRWYFWSRKKWFPSWYQWAAVTCVILGIIASATSSPTWVYLVVLSPFYWLAVVFFLTGPPHFLFHYTVYRLQVRYGMLYFRAKRLVEEAFQN